MVQLLFCLIIIIIILFLLILNYNRGIEKFSNNDGLYIKKTSEYEKVFSNSKYSVWSPKPVNEYYPIGHYISKGNTPPKSMAILVKNNSGIDSNDKPIKYEIVSITNNNYAIWKPIAAEGYVEMGHILSKEYPSKYLIRTVPKKFVNKSSINKRITNNTISKFDKGYELWDIKNSDLFVCNNLNNKSNLNYIKDVYSFKEQVLNIEEKLKIKTVNTYKKICEYKDEKLDKDFYVWRPIAVKNYCSLGDIILNNKTDPNKVLDTIVVHKSFCKIPIDYGNKSISKINNKNKDSSKNINFWRPRPHKDYYFFGDIVVVGDEQPEADNLIYSIHKSYIKNLNDTTHTLVYNNINDQKPLSIWSDKNNFLTVNNVYDLPSNNNNLLNMEFTESDLDLSDIRKPINISYKKNNNMKKISNNELLNLVKKNLSNKLDVKIDRLNTIKIDKEFISLNIEPRKNSKSEPSINNIVKKLSKLLETEPLKIYNDNKDIFFVKFYRVYVDKKSNIIEIDNSEFRNLISL